MKYIASAILAATLVAGAQTKPAPPVSVTEHGQLLITQLKLAISEAQLASLAAQHTPQAEDALKAAQKAQALIESTRIDLGLDASYHWDFQTQAYVQAPVKPDGKK